MSSNLSAKPACFVCGSRDHLPLVLRDAVPVNQHCLMASAESARGIRRGRLDMRLCRGCGFVFNAAFDPALVTYDATYDNTQVHSASFSKYAEQLATNLVHDKGVRDCRIVEIGCGKGHFLRWLVELDAGNRGRGYDPSHMGPTTEIDGRLRFHKAFYGRRNADADADVVVCRHVIEHIDRPLDFLTMIRATLGNGHARIFFETPCVEWILRRQVIWDFFYEHCSLFSAASLTEAFERSGFDVVSVEHVFAGQYLWLEATPRNVGSVAKSVRRRFEAVDSVQSADTTAAGVRHTILDAAKAYTQFEQPQISALRNFTHALRQNGPVVLWGAGAKGVTFAQLIDPDRELIARVVDVNPQKQGRYLPGTGHEICGPERLAESRTHAALVLNPNYFSEISATVKPLPGSIIPIDVMAHLGEYACN